MRILDTDHLSVFQRGGSQGLPFARRLKASSDKLAVTVISVEEQLRGWLAQVKRARTPSAEVHAYQQLLHSLRDFENWAILPWDELATREFARLRPLRLRIGTMDLRIASVALAHGATLLTRNLADFGQVPGLRVENWLDLN